MDATPFLTALLLLVACGLTVQMTDEDTAAAAATIDNNNNTVTPSNTTDAATIAILCATPHEVQGQCVQRQLCDYGPGAIDFTLFVPRRYVKPCNVTEVCCPFASILEAIPSNNQNLDDEFDDDD